MRGSSNPQAFQAYLEGQRLFSVISQTDMEECKAKFWQAIQLDNTFARAWGDLGYTIARCVLEGWMPADELDTAAEYALRAVELDGEDYATHWDLAFVRLNQGDFDEAEARYSEALHLYENNTDMIDRKRGLLAEMGEACVYWGDTARAVELLERAQRVPEWYRWNLAWAYFNDERYEDALMELQRMELLPGDPDYVMEICILSAAAYAQTDDLTLAQASLKAYRDAKGEYTIEDARRSGTFKHPEGEDHFLDALRKAGVPEN